MMTWERNIVIKSQEEIEAMRASGRVNAMAHDEVRKAIRPGITTAELDKIAETVIRDHGGTPTFLGYPGPYPYPGTINASINEELVHGLPSKRELKDGDIISIDCGTTLDGFVSDSAFTAAVGEVSEEAAKLMDVTREALKIGIDKMRPGNRIGDVGHTIQEYVESFGYHVPREYTGHGVGRGLHEGPQVPNYGVAGRGLMLRKGLTIALEPMVLIGTHVCKVLSDQWTVISADRSLTAHYEHTVAITDGEPHILTAL